jgi:hypothetical protein
MGGVGIEVGRLNVKRCWVANGKFDTGDAKGVDVDQTDKPVGNYLFGAGNFCPYYYNSNTFNK